MENKQILDENHVLRWRKKKTKKKIVMDFLFLELKKYVSKIRQSLNTVIHCILALISKFKAH